MGDMNKPRNMHINHSILKNQRLPSFLYFSPFLSVIGFTADVQLGFFVRAPILLKIIRTIETMKTVVPKSKKYRTEILSIHAFL